MKENTQHKFYCMYVMVMFHLGFTVKPSRASFATEARIADSNTTCAILHGWPAAVGVGDGTACADINPRYLEGSM